MTCYDLG